MNVNFDSLNRFETPVLSLCNPGCKYIDGTLSNAIGFLHNTSDEEIIMNFNETSELNFRLYDVKDEDDLGNSDIFDEVLNRRLIFAHGIGFFMITDIKENITGNERYKDVNARSIDAELEQKMVPYIEDGTYKFTDLIQKIIEVLPLWTINPAPANVANKYRTFEDVDVSANCLAFLLNDVQDAYECIFDFDTTNRIITVYDQNDYALLTDIHLTSEDLITSADITENADDVYTAISVRGSSDDIYISPVNPIGTNVIYNFTYYLDWMSDGLAEKVRTWQSELKSASTNYSSYNQQLYSLLTTRYNTMANIDAANKRIAMYKRCKDNLVASGNKDLVAEYSKVIVENGGVAIDISKEVSAIISDMSAKIKAEETQIAGFKTSLATTEASINTVQDSISAINQQYAITEYFTEDELAELYSYIFEGSYSDEYITVTDTMTASERFEQMKVLYDRAQKNLEKVSVPTLEYNIDVENFIFDKDFASWSRQLKAGCVVTVDLTDGDAMKLFLVGVTVNYDDASLTLAFGNSYNKFDPKSLFDDVLGNVNRSANTLNYIKDTIYPVKNGAIGMLSEEMRNVRNIAMDSALATTNGDVLIDGSGITSRRVLEDGEYAPEQLKITGENIVFTDDNWETSKLAIGKMMVDGEEKYGVNAELIYGDLILGENLNIENISTDNVVGKDGTTMTAQLQVMNGAISSKVSESDITGNLVVSAINQSPDTVKIDAKNIQLNGLVTADYIKNLNLEVGNQIKMGANASIKWDQVTDKSDVPTKNEVTTITNNAISTASISANQISTTTGTYGATNGWDSLTLAYIVDAMSGKVSQSTAIAHGADANGDGVVDALDLNLVTMRLLGLNQWNKNGGNFSVNMKNDNPYSAISIKDGNNTAFAAGIHGAYARSLMLSGPIQGRDNTDSTYDLKAASGLSMERNMAGGYITRTVVGNSGLVTSRTTPTSHSQIDLSQFPLEIDLKSGSNSSTAKVLASLTSSGVFFYDTNGNIVAKFPSEWTDVGHATLGVQNTYQLQLSAIQPYYKEARIEVWRIIDNVNTLLLERTTRIENFRGYKQELGYFRYNTVVSASHNATSNVLSLWTNDSGISVYVYMR